MTKPISTDGIEFIEVDGLKIRFQRNKVGEGIPVVLTSPWPESLYAYQRIWPILGAEASLSRSTSLALANRKAGRN